MGSVSDTFRGKTLLSIIFRSRSHGTTAKVGRTRRHSSSAMAAALVPAMAGSAAMPRTTAGLGVFIVIAEDIQQLYQFHANRIAYRSTWEALKHEKFLYLAKAGHYGTAADAHALLAERIESFDFTG